MADPTHAISEALALETAGEFYKAGRAYDAADDVRSALRCFDLAVQKDPTDRWSLSLKCLLLDIASEAQLAPQPHLQHYLLEPPLFETLDALHAELISSSEALITLNDDARKRINHAEYLARVGRSEQAMAILRECRDKEPVALLTIAKLLEDQGQLDAALHEVKTFLAEKGESSLDGYADEIRILTRMKDEEALAQSKQRYREHLQGKIEQYPEDAEWYQDALKKIR